MFFTYTVKFLYFEHSFEKKTKKCLKMAQILFLVLLSKGKSVYSDLYTKMVYRSYRIFIYRPITAFSNIILWLNVAKCGSMWWSN